jgi:nitroreductase
MMVCPNGAITINGRCVSDADLTELPPDSEIASFEAELALMRRRRSIREFKDEPVDKALLEKVLEAARTSPMGLPPSDVNVLIFDSKEKVRAFTEDFCAYLEGMKWFVSNWFLALMRPFWGKSNDKIFRDFVRPCLNAYTNSMKKGENIVTYDAPVAMYFYGSPYSDPADPIVAATHAMLAAEALGLGTCMLGAIHPLIQSGRAARRFREKHGIHFASLEGLFVIMGHSAVKYVRSVKRTFAAEDWI